MDKKALLKELADAVVACAPDRATVAARRALEEGLNPVEAINEGRVVGMGVIGDNYAERKMYLPQVLVAAHAMYNGLDVLLPAIPKADMKDTKQAETAVVQGDVHDIGKNIVKTMLTASGYVVDDLGKDVSPNLIADTAKDKGIHVVCLSTLMTPTMDNMAAAVKALVDYGYWGNCSVTIGGPPTTEGFAKEIGADGLAHGSTGAGNDQVRFDLCFSVFAPEMEIITPTRDLKLSREEEIAYLKSKGVERDWSKMAYSINKGLWGTSVGGKETLNSWEYLPGEAYPSSLEKEGEEELILSFERGELCRVNGECYTDKIEAIRRVEALASAWAIGRDTHVGDTIVGIKGRVGFEAAAPLMIIKAHELLEKHTLTIWQMYWKEQLANWYGMFLHEA